MSLTSEIIIDAYRETNLIGLGEEGDAAQGAEALRLLNRIVASVFGNEVGENLSDWVFPPVNGWVQPFNYIPPDTRLVMGLNAGAMSFMVNPSPENGDRISLLDAGSGFAANNVTLIKGPAKFNGSSSNYVASTDGLNQTWIYRADLGDWARVLPLDPAGEFPFPQKHDDAFIGMLAARLDPRYEKSLSEESRGSLQRATTQLRAAYARTRLEPADLATLRLRNDCYRPYYGEGQLYGY